MLVDADLDGGAIEIVSAADPRRIELLLRPDTSAAYMQWFHFRTRVRTGRPTCIRIANAGEATYADAWEGYRACASYDRRRWFRVPTDYDGEALTIRHTPTRDSVSYAYFVPYPIARRDRLLARAVRAPWARVEPIGESVEGRPIRRLVFGEPAPGRRRVWIIARQHPGETMAEWFAEGAIDRLLDAGDPLAEVLLERAVVSIVPCMNPDGGVLGNQRTNAAGTDLNRSWLDPDEDEAPEVAAARACMLDEGVDLFLDVHGDERNEACFAAGCEGNPGFSPRLEALEDAFIDDLATADPDFVRENLYGADAPGAGELRCAANWVGEAFDCLALTLEMPFKDAAPCPDPADGFTPLRAARLGRRALGSVLTVLDDLR
jgi:murein tripeptide amidase MpaA